ncbi:DoxX-like family protein [Sinomicrobium weinanense]|uniref:DoxX-like family protein n=1 Tax=Sinomicrobium weinanense TaxID=2842200 RepID=A0A926JUX8_9FLAO|nr:DoxX-like family protein [Sinomicrobium weinanense]MBC9797774.1 DoxX-like family protein [Sinomicrobium weinanense]MBU3122407.1 DoxX-like family protein [Sinomicrobium weinanense]
MTAINTYRILTFFITGVWLINGLVCKMLNLVPRHQQIVARILGEDHSRHLTILIGFSEIIMGIWVLTRFKSKFNAITQIIIVVIMNTLEFILTPDLLLWGRLNAVFALLFVGLVYYNEFVLNRKLKLQTLP